jgi:hypothetical protein
MIHDRERRRHGQADERGRGIVAEMERLGVAGAVADLGFDPMPMAQAVIRTADGVVVPFPGAAQSGIGRLAVLADRQRGSVLR